MATNLSEHIWVDFAEGGWDHRNNIRRIQDVRVNGAADVGASYQRATSALPEWVRTHRNKRNHPTVSGFNGPTWTPAAPLDIDHPTDASVSLEWTRQIARQLGAHGVPLDGVGWYFSGGKGFHVMIPAAMFGGFEPSVDLHRYLKRVAELILGDIPFDTSVYDKLRLWRLPNSRHGKTGLYKVQLTAQELLTLSIDQIRDLARAPRAVEAVPELAPTDDDDWLPVDALVALWREAQEYVQATPKRTPGVVTDAARDAHTVAAIATSWPHGGLNDAGASRHADYLLPIAGFLARRTTADHVRDLLQVAAERADDHDFLHTGRDWKGEIERLANDSADKYQDDKEVLGLPTLSVRFPALAVVLRALWPDPTFEAPPAGATPRTADSETVPPFPLETLPEAFRTLVEQGAASLCAPPDLIAVPLLVAAGVAIGDAVELEIKSGWREAANLSAVEVAPPGRKKSPAQALALGPLHCIQRRLEREYHKTYEEYETKLEEWENTRKQDRGAKPRPPAFRHVLTTDATTEALGPMLLASKGVLMFREELTGWVRSMDQYRQGRGADRQHYLSAWSRMPIKIDRKSGAPLVVPRPFLSVFGGIQPDLLPDLADAAQREDGFLDRLLYSFPELVPDRWTEQGIAPEAIQAVDEVFATLYRRAGDVSTFGDPVPRVVTLSNGARALWRRWYDEHAAEQDAEGFSQRLAGPWAKMPAQLARLTLILHVLHEPDAEQVSAETLGRAAEVIDYFKAHARKVYQHLGRQRRSLVLRVLQAIQERGDVPQHVLTRQVFQRNVPAEHLRAALEELEEAGLVRRRREETGGRTATVWSRT